MITFRQGTKSVNLPKPVFNDTEAGSSQLLVKRARSGKTFTYNKTNNNKVFDLTFIDVHVNNYYAFRDFYAKYIGKPVVYIDYDGDTNIVNFIGNSLTAEFHNRGKFVTFSITCQET